MVTKAQIENCNQVILKYGYEMRFEILETEDIFIKVQRKTTGKLGFMRKFYESLKRTYEELTKE